MTDTDALAVATNDIATNVSYLTYNMQLLITLIVIIISVWVTSFLVKYIQSIWTDFMS